MTPFEKEAAMFSSDGQRGDLNRPVAKAVRSLAKGVYRSPLAFFLKQSLAM